MTEYELLCRKEGGADSQDINEHLPTLKHYATGLDTVIEMGVRHIVSTWALLEGKPKYLLGIDIAEPPLERLEAIEIAALEQGTKFEFWNQSSLECEIPECDMLFIDTLHEFSQLNDELVKHAHKVKKYLGFHDTESCASELWPAIGIFLAKNPQWRIVDTYRNCNGLLILERI